MPPKAKKTEKEGSKKKQKSCGILSKFFALKPEI